MKKVLFALGFMLSATASAQLQARAGFALIEDTSFGINGGVGYDITDKINANVDKLTFQTGLDATYYQLKPIENTVSKTTGNGLIFTVPTVAQYEVFEDLNLGAGLSLNYITSSIKQDYFGGSYNQSGSVSDFSVGFILEAEYDINQTLSARARYNSAAEGVILGIGYKL
ncbi:MAG: hypothetical protein C4K58_07265 [Flavobacteriaceae bacterium]|nr:MAG: hypothetical protein C4K58_07265 [Flavobacteriaceae bacterium]